MYLGHVGIALAAKGVRRDVALLVLLIATYAPDWVDSGLCLAGAYDPRGMFSHSLPAVAVMSVIAVAAYRIYSRDSAASWLIAAVIFSHVLMDLVTGHKPTWPGGPMIGLGLYRQPLADFLVEGALIVAGVTIYRHTLPPRSRPWIDVAAMAGALILMQAAITLMRALTVALPKC